ncbi:MAG: nucleotidyltransferase substrate binding protein [Candidatus Melainabacteria bacterium]|nr:nucleotidyltransferase substrate binding protein [Candidatus Melainabacteria bacterium]
MNQNRIKELNEDFKKSLSRLKAALNEDLSLGNIVIDGTIQRFEFTFELSWKLLKLVLNQQGIEATTPRAAIKEAYKAKIINDGDGWIDMLEDRNKTSHIYDENQAKKIYEKIKKSHIVLFDALGNDLKIS